MVKDKFCKVCVLVFVNNGKNEYAFTKSKNKIIKSDGLCVPYAIVRAGETAIEACERAVKGEAGIRIMGLRLLTEGVHYYFENKDQNFVVLSFYATSFRDKPKKAVEWYREKDFPSEASSLFVCGVNFDLSFLP